MTTPVQMSCWLKDKKYNVKNVDIDKAQFAVKCL